jgi:hypothetical protein
MSDTALIAQAFRDAGRPLTLEEVLEATQLADEKKACGLIYYLVNQKRLQKAEPTDDGISRWCCPGVDPGAVSAPSAPARRPKRDAVPASTTPRAPKAASRPALPAASLMTVGPGLATWPEVCVNFGTATVVITCGDGAVKIATLTAAQHLLAQMEQAIAALGALDGR